MGVAPTLMLMMNKLIVLADEHFHKKDLPVLSDDMMIYSIRLSSA